MAQDLENMQNDDFGQKLNAMLSDPESLSKLAAVASSLASSGVLSRLMANGGNTQESDQNSTDHGTSAEPLTENASVGNLPTEQASAGSHGGHGRMQAVNSRHTALLRALKPYLGEQKQARVDQMMRLLQLAELADTVLRGK